MGKRTGGQTTGSPTIESPEDGRGEGMVCLFPPSAFSSASCPDTALSPPSISTFGFICISLQVSLSRIHPWLSVSGSFLLLCPPPPRTTPPLPFFTLPCLMLLPFFFVSAISFPPFPPVSFPGLPLPAWASICAGSLPAPRAPPCPLPASPPSRSALALGDLLLALLLLTNYL